MTGFSMPCYIKLVNVVGSCCLMLALLVPPACAEGVSVSRAEARLTPEGYQLKADFSIHLNFPVQQALSHGVPIYFIGEFSLTRSRWYWFDEQISKSEQVAKLYYNVLTRQYRISRGSLFQSFATLDDALVVIQRQYSPVIAQELLANKGNYLAGVRLRLDTEQLPKLLQVNAFTGKDWDLDSDWYRWVVYPAELAERLREKQEGGQ